MQKFTSHLLILWMLLIISVVSAHGQNILVLQLPEPCFSTETATTPIQISHPFQFAINPNPAKEELTLTVSDKETIGLMKIHIADIRGVAIFDEQFFSSHQIWIKTIDISHLKNGIYIISVLRNGQRVSQKIIKQ